MIPEPVYRPRYEAHAWDEEGGDWTREGEVVHPLRQWLADLLGSHPDLAGFYIHDRESDCDVISSGVPSEAHEEDEL